MSLYRLFPPAVLLGVLAGCAESRPEYVSASDKFGVRFRTSPRVGEKTIGGSRATVYASESRDGADTVVVAELPLKGDEPPEAVPWVLNSAKDDLVRRSRGRLLSESSPTLAGKYPGREVVAAVSEPEPSVLRARLYFARGRLYQVLVMGTADYANSDAATAFLDSFRLTE